MRAESGPVKFKNDWTGVFIRGDNALAYVLYLQKLLDEVSQNSDDIIAVSYLQGLINLLSSCEEFSSENKNIQLLKTFEECKIDDV